LHDRIPPRTDRSRCGGPGFFPDGGECSVPNCQVRDQPDGHLGRRRGEADARELRLRAGQRGGHHRVSERNGPAASGAAAGAKGPQSGPQAARVRRRLGDRELFGRGPYRFVPCHLCPQCRPNGQALRTGRSRHRLGVSGTGGGRHRGPARRQTQLHPSPENAAPASRFPQRGVRTGGPRPVPAHHCEQQRSGLFRAHRDEDGPPVSQLHQHHGLRLLHRQLGGDGPPHRALPVGPSGCTESNNSRGGGAAPGRRDSSDQTDARRGLLRTEVDRRPIRTARPQPAV